MPSFSPRDKQSDIHSRLREHAKEVGRQKRLHTPSAPTCPTPPMPERTIRRAQSHALLSQNKPVQKPMVLLQRPLQFMPLVQQPKPTATVPQPVHHARGNAALSGPKGQPVPHPPNNPLQPLRRDVTEDEVVAALPPPDKLRPSALGEKSLFQQRLTNLLRSEDIDALTCKSIRGDPVPKNAVDVPVSTLKLTGVEAMFPSIITLQESIARHVQEARFTEAYEISKQVTSKIREALDSLEELPTPVLQLHSFKGKRLAVEFLNETYSRFINELHRGSPSKDVNELQEVITPTLDALKMLVKALDTHIHGAAVDLREYDKIRKKSLVQSSTGDKYKAFSREDHSEFSKTLDLLLEAHNDESALVRIKAEGEKYGKDEVEHIRKANVVMGSGEAPYQVILPEARRRAILAGLALNSHNFNNRQATIVKEHHMKSRDPSYLAGITISPAFTHARNTSTSTFATTTTTSTQFTTRDGRASFDTLRSTKSAFNLRTPHKSSKETPKTDEFGEYLFNVRNSTLYLSSPLKKKEKFPTVPPTGDAALIKMDGQNPGRVKAISVPAIVHQITSSKPDEIVPELEPTFMNTFRLITSSVDFLDNLVLRYTQHSPDILSFAHLVAWTIELSRIRSRVYKLLEQWFRDFWHRDEDCIIILPLLKFAKHCMITDDMRITQLLALFNTLCVTETLASHNQYVPQNGSQKRRDEVVQASTMLPPASPTNFQFSGKFSFDLCVDNKAGIKELARQITLIASDLYRNFETHDFVKFWIESASKNAAAPPSALTGILQTAVAQDSHLCYTVQLDILNQPTPAKRAERLMFWISVAQQCIYLRNFWGACAIINACGNSYMKCLRETVRMVPLDSRTTWHYISDAFDSRHNYKEYRKLLGDQDKRLSPTIPWLALLVHDVVHAREKIKMNRRADGLPEVDKLKMMYNTVNDMESCRIPYNFERHLPIREYILERYGYIMRIGLKAADERVKKTSDSYAAVENEHISKRGGWAEGVPDYLTRSKENLAIIFNET